MRISYLFLILLIVSGCSKGPAVDDQTYPWQIKLTTAGNSQVFGIEMGETPLGHAARTLNKRYEMGLFEDKQGRLSLEAYFNEVTRGGLSGKVIALLETDNQQLLTFKAHSLKGKRQDSGEIKYILTKNDQQVSEQLIIASLSYIPYVNLDKDMIEKRFGIADEMIKAKDGLVHYIYRKKGLDIIFNEDGKEVLQYVSPKNISQLLQPLQSQVNQ
ncbi:MAG: hypothetical protein P8Y24_04625 [Gammaproteobacteria bacterium]